MAQNTTLITKVLAQFHEQVLNLLDDLLSICPNEPDILMVRLFFENQIDGERLMTEFIKWVYPWKKYILERDERFFKENDHIFGPLPTNKVVYFKRKLYDGTFDEDDKNVIWDYFRVFISLIEQYNKLK